MLDEVDSLSSPLLQRYLAHREIEWFEELDRTCSSNPPDLLVFQAVGTLGEQDNLEDM
jgi:hypothetical protein